MRTFSNSKTYVVFLEKKLTHFICVTLNVYYVCMVLIIEFLWTIKEKYRLWIFWGWRFTLLHPLNGALWFDRLQRGRRAATPSLTLICERPTAPTPRQLVPILYSHNTHRSKWTTICRSIGRSVVCRSCFMRFDRIKKLDFTKNVLVVNSTGFSESVFVFEP